MSTPPNDLDVERSVLGATLVHPRTMLELSTLDRADFYDARHGAIWDVVQGMYRDETPIDTLSVTAALERSGVMKSLAPLGGKDYLVVLMGSVVTVENLGWQVRRLKTMARRRKWGAWAADVAARSRDIGVDDDEFLSDAERDAIELSTKADTTGGPVRFATTLREYNRVLDSRWDARQKGREISGLSLRLQAVDHITGGLMPGDLVIVAARPSMGKTAFSLNALIEAAAGGDPSLMFSYEMSARALAERAVARESGVCGTQLKRALLNQSEWTGIAKAMSKMSPLPLWIDDRGALNIHDLRTAARQWKAQQKVDDERGVIVVDYLQRVPGTDAREQNRVREIGKISSGLKSMAMELKLPVVALAQLSRRVDERADKRPMLSDLRESGDLEQDADTVMFLYREDYYDRKTEKQGVAEVIIGKQRNGDTGTAEVGWDKEHQRFYNLTE